MTSRRRTNAFLVTVALVTTFIFAVVSAEAQEAEPSPSPSAEPSPTSFAEPSPSASDSSAATSAQSSPAATTDSSLSQQSTSLDQTPSVSSINASETSVEDPWDQCNGTDQDPLWCLLPPPCNIDNCEPEICTEGSLCKEVITVVEGLLGSLGQCGPVIEPPGVSGGYVTGYGGSTDACKGIEGFDGTTVCVDYFGITEDDSCVDYGPGDQGPTNPVCSKPGAWQTFVSPRGIPLFPPVHSVTRVFLDTCR